MKNIVAAADFHDIDTDLFCPETFIEVFMDTCNVPHPNIIDLIGDSFAPYEFSHFEHGPARSPCGAAWTWYGNVSSAGRIPASIHPRVVRSSRA